MRDTINSVIIIGAGAAGLMAAKELSAKGYSVTILEGNNRIGGRIDTIHDASFDMPLELGAEFMHGNLPKTQQLLKEANIAYTPVEGKHVQVRQGHWKLLHETVEDWDVVINQMKELKKDMPFADFLNKYFSGEKYLLLRDMLRHYAEGFDVADINTASTMALYKEWSKEEEEQYRIEGGYYQLVEYLAFVCSQSKDFTINLNCAVKHITWSSNNVEVQTQNNQVFIGNKIIITVPISIFQSNQNDTNAISFSPFIDSYIEAAGKIGYGAVIKIFLQFKKAFWNEKSGNLGFIISDQMIPTWWTQFPSKSKLLTGWLGGPNAKALQSADPGIVLKLALESLSNIFSIEVDGLENNLSEWKIADWTTNQFSKGAYNFATIESNSARELLNTPIEGTIYFAGEALYNGIYPGTVEAALVSGKTVAEKLF